MKIIDYEDRYAAKLADMWNKSDEGWPGGLTRGVPMTADKVKESESRVRCYGRFIIMEKGKAIGFVRVNPYMHEKEAAYVSWLNVLPTHHGKSYGRKLLCRSVECTLENKLERLDLHTWPGNMKALPAYKKTGFFWVPKTTVYMQNYVPMIMQFRPAGPYFEKHDWYHTFQRPIEMVEDDVQVEGMNVFPYTWREGGEEITVWIDRESRGITGFENNDVKVFAKLDRHDVLAGMVWKMTWEVVNKSRSKMACRLNATPPKGVSLSVRKKKFDVPAGKKRRMSSRLKVSLDVKEKPWDEKSDSVLTRLSIGDESFVLRTGLRVKQAIEIETDPEFISVVPETEKKVVVNLKSNLKRRVKGRIHFEADGVELDKKSAPFTITSERTAGVPLTIISKSSETRSYPLRAWTEFEGLRTKEKVLRVRCVGLHGAVSDVVEDRLVMENAQLRLVALRKGAFIDLYDKVSRYPIAEYFNMRLGPPFWPSELSRLDFGMKVKNEKVSTTATLSTVSEEKGGLRVSLQIKMSSNDLVQILPILENKGKKKFEGRIQFFVHRELHEDKMTIPSKYGMIQEEVVQDDFPDWMEDVPKRGYFSETWIHAGNQETGLGMIWDPESSGEVELGGWGMTITLDCPEVKPGEKRELPPLHLVVANRDWKRVRKTWLQLSRGQVESEESISPRRVLEIATHPEPLVLEDETEFKLTVRNSRNKKIDAKIRLDFPANLRANRRTFEAEDLCLENPFEEYIRLKASRIGLGVFFAKARLYTPLYDDVLQLPIVVIGKPGSVSVRERKGKIRVDNGLMNFTVVPGFAGCITSLQKDGMEWVLSAYPSQSQLSWIRPWYGGLTPIAMKETFLGKLHEERFTHEKVTRGRWKGVRVQTTAKRDEKLRGLKVSTEYLTRPRSNVVAVLQDFMNTGKSSLYFEGGCFGFFLVEGSRRTSAYFSRSGWRQRKYTKWGAFSISDNRTIVVSNSRKRESVCLVSPSRRCKVMLFDLAREGKHILATSMMSLTPRESRRLINYIVLSTTPNEAKKYHVLSEYVDEDLKD
ncbi:MAG: GNAT family N-acetyltransferase [Thermoplasmata archaeon]